MLFEVLGMSQVFPPSLWQRFQRLTLLKTRLRVRLNHLSQWNQLCVFLTLPYHCDDCVIRITKGCEHESFYCICHIISKTLFGSVWYAFSFESDEEKFRLHSWSAKFCAVNRYYDNVCHCNGTTFFFYYLYYASRFLNWQSHFDLL